MAKSLNFHISQSLDRGPSGKGMVWGKVSLIAQSVKNLPAIQETQVQFLGQEDSLEKG